MLYTSHKDGVSERMFIFWYWFTKVILDNGPLNGFLLLLLCKGFRCRLLWLCDLLSRWLHTVDDCRTTVCSDVPASGEEHVSVDHEIYRRVKFYLLVLNS